MYLEALFKPKGIAVIGASRKPGKIGYAIMKNLVEYGYEGKIFAVNIKGEKIEIGGKEFQIYKSILDVPDEVDMAVIAIPAKSVPEVVEECGKKGVKVLSIISSGFREIGEKGKKLEETIVKIAHKYGMRILGPNVFGIVYTPTKLNATFGPRNVLPGKLAFITQSGALGIALMGWTALEKVGLSAIVSIGNKSDLDDADILEYFENDENTNTILIYIEGLKDGRKFMEVAKRVSMKKPVIAIKVGRSEKGAKAAASHTGSLAGSDIAYSTAFKQSGILRAMSVTEAFDWARALSNLPEPQGDNIVIITNGGGIGVIASDAVEEENLHLYDNLEDLKNFERHMPSFGSYKNPIDLSGMADVKAYEGAIRDALANPNIHAIVVLYCQTAVLNPIDFAKTVLKEYEASGKKKPIVVAMVGGVESKKAIDMLNENGIPAYPEAERAIKSLSALYKWHKWKKSAREEIEEEIEIEVNQKLVDGVIEKFKEKSKRIVGIEGFPILEAYGIKVAPYGIAKTVQEAKEIAEKIGYPVVLKVISPDVIHKTDVGGIKLNVNENEIEDAFSEILSNVKNYVPEARIDGILVQKMVKDGKELIVGMKRDPQFGPLLMFGMGGIYVELLKDVSFRIAPITRKDAYEMIKEIKAYKILRGLRGEKPVDIDAIVDLLLRISKISIEHPEIFEIDLNPIKVFENGYVVVDFRMVLDVNR